MPMMMITAVVKVKMMRTWKPRAISLNMEPRGALSWPFTMYDSRKDENTT